MTKTQYTIVASEARTCLAEILYLHSTLVAILNSLLQEFYSFIIFWNLTGFLNSLDSRIPDNWSNICTKLTTNSWKKFEIYNSKKITISKNRYTVRYKLQEAGLYTVIKEDEELNAFRQSLHQAEGHDLASKTKQFYNYPRKILHFLVENVSTIDYNSLFASSAIAEFFENLIDIDIKRHFIISWIIRLENFSKFLYDRTVITKNTFKSLQTVLNNYNRISNISQCLKNIYNRRKYSAIAEGSSTFSWMKSVELLITPTLTNTIPVSCDEANLFVTYIAGLILRLGHSPQVVTNFTVDKYKQGKQYNLFFISNIKSQENGMASFKLENSTETDILDFYYNNVRQFDNTYENFLLTAKGTLVNKPLQFIRPHKHNISGMEMNTRNYRHIIATKIQENVDNPETRKHLHQEINQTESTARKKYKLQTIAQTSKNIDRILELIEEESE